MFGEYKGVVWLIIIWEGVEKVVGEIVIIYFFYDVFDSFILVRVVFEILVVLVNIIWIMDILFSVCDIVVKLL